MTEGELSLFTNMAIANALTTVAMLIIAVVLLWHIRSHR